MLHLHRNPIHNYTRVLGRRSEKKLYLALTWAMAAWLCGVSGVPAQNTQAGLQPGIFQANDKTTTAHAAANVPAFQAPRSFTVQETYHQNAQNAPADDRATQGVVGLDLLVQTDAYPKVQGVFPGTPAQKQGIRSGDVLVAVNGESTLHKDLSTLDAMISDVPGDVVRLGVLRGGQLKQVSLTVVSLAALSRELQASFSALGPRP